jgi:hypothetical protein
MAVFQFSSATSATQTKPIELRDDARRHYGDLERLTPGQAFEDDWDEIDAADLPSFRPLSRGVPSPHRTAHTPRFSPPLAETSAATAPLPFSRARALVAAHASLQVDAWATSDRRDLGSRRFSQRSPRPFLLVCFFVAGAVAGLGGAYVVGTERIVDGTIGHARTALSSLTGIAHQ